MNKELTVKELAWTCPKKWIPWKTSKEVGPAKTIVGQERAVSAIAFGLAMRGVGFNVFVTGLSGTGRLTTIKRYIEPLVGLDPTPDDVCFVFNFRSPEQPRHLCLHAGAGVKLRDGMQAMIKDLAESLPSLFSDKDFHQQVERAVADLKEKEKELIETFESRVSEAGFVMVQIQAGPVTRPEVLPLVNDKPVAMDELSELVESGALTVEQARQLEETYASFSNRLQEVFQGVNELRNEVQKRVYDVRQKTVQPVFEDRITRLRKEVDDERADWYFKALAQDLDENIDQFAPSEGPVEGDPFLRWRVNLVVDNSEKKGKPVVLETEPTFSNLFGTIERSMTASGEVTTNFTRIRAGSLLRANGGFLVLNAEDLLQESRAWPALKRTLKYRRARIQTLESVILGASAIKPEEVPIDVKVLVIGTRHFYDMLYRYDHDFPKVFKVLADFDSMIPATKKTVREVLSVLTKVSAEEQLLAMDRSGMAAMMEEAVRMGHWRRRFSSRFSDLADLLREADYEARNRKAELITSEHVLAARAAHHYRHSLSEDRTQEFLEEGVVRVETEGTEIGQVNGLAVYDLGHHRFGKPSRISARVGLGREGVINVERQAGLSGPTHDKGVQILTGFLRGTFARNVPLNMGCSITFEQSYGGIDGDSASSTEIYAVLSALIDMPLRQDIAVTGSVDQYGRVQAIGGANEKIEGFFRLCKSRGLTGEQGVMIPSANVGDLHLSLEVREAVGDGKFHIWPIDTVEQGIELLSGEPAGEWTEEEDWAPESVYGRCQKRLEEMARLLRQAGKDATKEEKEDEEGANGSGEESDGQDGKERDKGQKE
jgi:lon-related putative ATP-dependent protease